MSLDADGDFSAMVARFMNARSPIDRSRQDAEVMGRPPLWSGLAAEVGVVGLQVESRHGGQDAGVNELGTAVFEAARTGWSGPLVACAGAGVHLLKHIDADDGCGLQSAIAAGDQIVVAAVHEQARGEDLVPEQTVVELGSDAAVVTGRKLFVDGGMQADIFLVVARDPKSSSGQSVVRVDASAEGVVVNAMESVDPGRAIAEVVFEQAVGTIVASRDAIPGAVEDSWLVGAVLTAADGLGLATQALELSRDYALTREQFDRPIATFQVVKHKLVDMYVDLQTAISAVQQALGEIDADAPGWRLSASMAKARSSDAVMHVVREAIQVHGGIGFTWEHELSHHFRRATAQRVLYGSPAAHRRRVAAAWGL